MHTWSVIYSTARFVKADWCRLNEDGSVEFWKDKDGSHYGLLLLALAVGQWDSIELID